MNKYKNSIKNEFISKGIFSLEFYLFLKKEELLKMREEGAERCTPLDKIIFDKMNLLNTLIDEDILKKVAASEVLRKKRTNREEYIVNVLNSCSFEHAEKMHDAFMGLDVILYDKDLIKFIIQYVDNDILLAAALGETGVRDSTSNKLVGADIRMTINDSKYDALFSSKKECRYNHFKFSKYLSPEDFKEMADDVSFCSDKKSTAIVMHECDEKTNINKEFADMLLYSEKIEYSNYMDRIPTFFIKCKPENIEKIESLDIFKNDDLLSLAFDIEGYSDEEKSSLGKIESFIPKYEINKKQQKKFHFFRSSESLYRASKETELMFSLLCIDIIKKVMLNRKKDILKENMSILHGNEKDIDKFLLNLKRKLMKEGFKEGDDRLVELDVKDITRYDDIYDSVKEILDKKINKFEKLNNKILYLSKKFSYPDTIKCIKDVEDIITDYSETQNFAEKKIKSITASIVINLVSMKKYTVSKETIENYKRCIEIVRASKEERAFDAIILFMNNFFLEKNSKSSLHEVISAAYERNAIAAYRNLQMYGEDDFTFEPAIEEPNYFNNLMVGLEVDCLNREGDLSKEEISIDIEEIIKLYIYNKKEKK